MFPCREISEPDDKNFDEETAELFGSIRIVSSALA